MNAERRGVWLDIPASARPRAPYGAGFVVIREEVHCDPATLPNLPALAGALAYAQHLDARRSYSTAVGATRADVVDTVAMLLRRELEDAARDKALTLIYVDENVTTGQGGGIVTFSLSGWAIPMLTAWKLA